MRLSRLCSLKLDMKLDTALLWRWCISPLDQLRESVASLRAWAVLISGGCLAGSTTTVEGDGEDLHDGPPEIHERYAGAPAADSRSDELARAGTMAGAYHHPRGPVSARRRCRLRRASARGVPVRDVRKERRGGE